MDLQPLMYNSGCINIFNSNSKKKLSMEPFFVYYNFLHLHWSNWFQINHKNDVFNDEDKNERIMAADCDMFSFSAMTIL